MTLARTPPDAAAGFYGDSHKIGTLTIPYLFDGARVATYLLTWNPNRPDADLAHFKTLVETFNKDGAVNESWGCGGTKGIVPGDTVFLVQLGTIDSGIVGAGTVVEGSHMETHWREEKRLRNEQARMVTVRFTYLSMQPLINRLELNEPPFAGRDPRRRWSPQGSGPKLEPHVAAEVQNLFDRRLALIAHAGGDYDAVLKARWLRYRDMAAGRSQTSFYNKQDSGQAAAIGEAQEVFSRFFSGEISLAKLQSICRQKNAETWQMASVEGLSGFQVVTKLNAYIGHETDFLAVLQRALRAPENPQQAQKQGDELIAYCEDAIATGRAKRKDLSSANMTTFLSCCWHLQRPQLWPIYAKATIDLLCADGILQPIAAYASIEGYLSFCGQVLRLQQLVPFESWELPAIAATLMPEKLITTREQFPAGSVAPAAIDETGGSKHKDLISEALASIGARVGAAIWLIAPGRNGKFMAQCLREKVVCIGWEFMGDLAQYAGYEDFLVALKQKEGATKKPSNNAHACEDFAQTMQPGDVVLAKKGRGQIIAWGVVDSAYRYDPDPVSRPGYPHVRAVTWKSSPSSPPWQGPLELSIKTLTKMNDYVDLVLRIFDHFGLIATAAPPPGVVEETSLPYGVSDLRRDMFMADKDVDAACLLLRARQNIILQGPPGVGKSFLAKRLAYALIGKQPHSATPLQQLAFVQFHQSYSYEHFVRGYRPNGANSFVPVDGVFLKFCEAARNKPELPFVLIIDEINRGNLSKIFGELLMLIEADKRSAEWGLSLAYDSVAADPLATRFYVPKNLYIIGTMNTADRALVLPDYALRRRFAFLSVAPGFSHGRFAQLLREHKVSQSVIDHICAAVAKLNQAIARDHALGEGFCIGHSYFCSKPDFEALDANEAAWCNRIIETEILPLLREYWFDRKGGAEATEKQLLLPVSQPPEP